MAFRIKLLGLVCLWLIAGDKSVYGQQLYTDLVNLFMGTSGDHGQVSPAATVPFGMVAVGPDSSPRQHAGYDYAETRTSGISVNRLSGVGCGGCGGNLSIRPVAYEQEWKRIPETETASPGYYSVAFDDGTTVCLTATERMAVEKYHFDRKKKEQALYVDFFSSFSERRHSIKKCRIMKYRVSYRVEILVESVLTNWHSVYTLIYLLFIHR